MYSFQIAVILVILTSFVYIGYQLFLIRKSLQDPADVPAEQHVAEVAERVLSVYEIERIERENQFDDRIGKLKEELASQQTHVVRRSVLAEELHPDVKNLPHNIIESKYGYTSDVEVAE